MEVVLIELGSYSVKFLRGIIERRTIRYSDFCEKILHETDLGSNILEERDNSSFVGLSPVEEKQFELIDQYLNKNDMIEKVIIAIPSYYSTLRFIELPVKNKKKIEQMLPFQLEEELPYPLSDAHLAFFPIILSKGSYCIVSSTHIKQFEHFFERSLNLLRPPVAIISDESIYQALVLEHDLSDSIAIINLGHSECTCYLFSNKRLVSVETSFVCGRVTDEIISETYQIGREEAILFKHQNAFFLTEDQKNNADDNQKEFSLLMKKIFSRFIDDFKRWNVGYQLKTRQHLQKVFITGGMSNIKNIDNFLTQNIDIPVEHFNYLQQTEISDLRLPISTLRSLTSCYGLSYHITSKNGLSNFINKDYAAPSGRELSLYSIPFVAIRIALACLLLFLVLVFENVQLDKSEKKIVRKVSDQLKDSVFAITPSQRRKLVRDTKGLFSSLKAKNREVNDKISLLNELSMIDGIGPLHKLGQTVGIFQGIELVSFKNENKYIHAIFQGENNQILKSLARILNAQNYNEMTVSLQEEEKRLEITYNDQR